MSRLAIHRSPSTPQLLTVLTPVVPAEEASLEVYLRGLAGSVSPFARVAALHVARCVVIGQLRSDFAGAPRMDHRLKMRYLLFTAVHDGSFGNLLGQMRQAMQPELPEIWGRCVNCPDPATADFDSYLKHNTIPIRQRWAAHRVTVEGVRAATGLRRQHGAFAVAADGLGPAAALAAFDAEFRS